MIVPMTKVSLVTTERDQTVTIERLKDLGVLHVETHDVRSERLTELLETRQLVQRGLQVLPAEEKGAGPEDATIVQLPENPVPAAIGRAGELIDKQDEIRSLAEEADRLAKEAATIEPWGDFDPDVVRGLREKGIHIRLFVVSPDALSRFPDDVDFLVVSRGKTAIRLAAVTRDDRSILDSAEFPLPARSLARVREAVAENRRKQRALREEIESATAHRTVLSAAIDSLDDQIEFALVHDGMVGDGPLRYTTGFMPAEEVPRIQEAASRYGWGLLIQEPDAEDAVPTKTRNPGWVQIIRPIFGLIGTVPGYFERDISIWFLLFLTIFFAMLYGDAGYGSLFFVGAIAGMISRKSKGKPGGEMLALVAVFSAATIVWGAITGTWFGVEAIARTAPFSWLIVPALSSFNPRSTENVKFICFVLAVAQVGIAHIWNFFRALRGPHPLTAFAQLGWLAIVLGAYNLALNLVISPTEYPLLSVSLYAILGGILVVLVFANQRGNFVKGLAEGFAVPNIFPTVLNTIGAFSDLVSYIRLFAVGLASASIAISFNTMAAGVAHGPVGYIGAGIILLFGHSLNLALGALAIIVHGVRLNLLEFSANHLGIEWKGTAYRPFAHSNEQQIA